MNYMVSYSGHGDADTAEFQDMETALAFIRESWNDKSYGDFQLYKKIHLQFSVTAKD